MLSRAFTFLAVLLVALHRVIPFHRWEGALHCIDPSLVAECSHIILEGEFRIVDEDYGQEDAEKGQLAQRHLLG
jgi:hypothetical protein